MPIGLTQLVIIINSLFSKAALYRTAKPVIDELQKAILNLMHAGYKRAIDPENKWGPDRSKQFIISLESKLFLEFRMLSQQAI
jgi:hypothetical protein